MPSIKSLLQNRRAVVLMIAFLAFISLGLPDGVLGVAWPSMRHVLGQAVDRLGVVILCGTSGYFLSSFFGGTVAGRLGVGNVLLISTLLVTAALVGYALAPAFAVVCGAAFVMGLGSGSIDASMNTYVAERFGPVWMSWLHGFYGVGATLGPVVMTASVAIADRSGSEGYRTGYGTLAGIMGGMVVVFLLSRNWWTPPHTPPSPPSSLSPTQPTPLPQSSAAVPVSPAGVGASPAVDAVEPRAGLWEALSRRAVWGQMALFFVYCGIEVTAGQWLFTLLTEGRHHSTWIAGTSVTAYWGLFTAGRFILGLATLRFATSTILRGAMMCSPGCIGLLWAGISPEVDMAAAALLGFCLAPVYPMLMSETAERVGKRLAPQAISLQVSIAIVGIALFPSAAGQLAKHSLEWIPPMLLGMSVVLLGLGEICRGVGREG